MNIIQIQTQLGTIGALDQYIIAPLQDVVIPIVQMVLVIQRENLIMRSVMMAWYVRMILADLIVLVLTH
jgi:hypothetical protein